MKTLTRTICLTLTLLLGSVGTSWGADFDKGLAAAQSGDFATALREFRPLAQQGYAEAQYQLGVMYYNRKGGPLYKTVLKWYTLAAEQGYARAQNNLGVMYYNGEGVSQDYKIALKWYTLAAEQGHAKAQSTLGVMYYNGEGVSQDNVYAHMWLNIAASSGHKSASKNRDIIAKRMTPSQLEKAQDLVTECVRKNYKGC